MYECNGECGKEKKRVSVEVLKEALRYGFVTLMGDIAKPLFWGLIIGAAITVAIPENLGEWISGNG
ncbi:MAG: hypothetical protein L3J42_00150 [Hydrogenimonas sp.]|nr:hypothetical protein [Hydrogenimonas sp.]